jgi:hypothetical protein
MKLNIQLGDKINFNFCGKSYARKVKGIEKGLPVVKVFCRYWNIDFKDITSVEKGTK